MNFAKLSEATEVVLFERATFLVIAHVNGSETVSNDRDQHAPPPPPDVHRFEKISNIVKQFKLSCRYIPHIKLSKLWALMIFFCFLQ